MAFGESTQTKTLEPHRSCGRWTSSNRKHGVCLLCEMPRIRLSGHMHLDEMILRIMLPTQIAFLVLLAVRADHRLDPLFKLCFTLWRMPIQHPINQFLLP